MYTEVHFADTRYPPLKMLTYEQMKGKFVGKGKSNFSEKFRKLINRYKRIGYSLDIMRQTACLVVNPIIVDGYASLFNCTTAVRASDNDGLFVKL